jgi:hypothetical protein
MADTLGAMRHNSDRASIIEIFHVESDIGEVFKTGFSCNLNAYFPKDMSILMAAKYESFRTGSSKTSTTKAVALAIQFPYFKISGLRAG